jgi:hypothetical protein
MAQMQKWAKENNKDMKAPTKQFKKEIDSIPDKNKKQIEEKAYQTASEFFKAFRAKGSASLIKKISIG